MLCKFVSAVLVGGLMMAAAMPAEADPERTGKGYALRRGGYSYNKEDSINTYGDSRSKYGAASSYRDPRLDRQTVAGPFDHGFFFDSAIGARGGDAPYMN